MAESSSQPTRISSYLILIILITLALSFVALLVAVQTYASDPFTAGMLILFGFIGVALSGYTSLQIRRRASRLRIVVPPVTTTIECRKCGFKSVREFQRGDFVFKELDPCQKCNDRMTITAIYREVKEGEKR